MVSLLLTAHLLLPTPVCKRVDTLPACFHVHTRTCVRTHTPPYAVTYHPRQLCFRKSPQYRWVSPEPVLSGQTQG